MAARAIVGIALGMLFAPIAWMLLVSINQTMGSPNVFSDWWWTLFGSGDFTGWIQSYLLYGTISMYAPLTGATSLIEGFGGGSLLTIFWPLWGAACVTWVIVGMWAGAIERSPGRGIGVGAGIWLGWVIIEVIYAAILGTIGTIGTMLLNQVLTLILVIIVAAVFGAMTKSEEF